MFLRRLYYDNSTEKILLSYMSRNFATIPTVDEDFNTKREFLGRERTSISYLEWLEFDPQIEMNFMSKIPKVVGGVLQFVEIGKPIDYNAKIIDDAIDEIKQEVQNG